MAKQDNHSETNQKNYSDGAFRHIRKDPVTGQDNYYYPMEITDPSDRVLARERGLEICRTRLGGRVFEAVMVPCKDVATIHGMEVFVDTPSEVQHRRYLDLISDELAEQDRMKRDGRCQIPDGRGGLRRCPLRVPNPDYVPGGDERKTLAVSCSGCPYEDYRQAHTVIPLSCLDGVDEDGETEPFDPPATKNIDEAERFLKQRTAYIAFVRNLDQKLVPLAELRTLGYSKAEASCILGVPPSTINDWNDKLKNLLKSFLSTLSDP